MCGFGRCRFRRFFARMGGFGARSAERARARCRRDGRLSVVLGGSLLGKLGGGLLMLGLRPRGADVHSMRRRGLPTVGAACGPAGAALVTDARSRRIVGDGAVVEMAAVHVAHVVDAAIVVEIVMVPIAALIAQAIVTIAVIDVAVIADAAAPIAGVEGVEAVVPAPIARSPVQVRLRRQHPGTGNPIIIGAVPGPIAGRPEIADIGQRRLIIFRQRRRSDGDIHRRRNLSLRARGQADERRRRQHENEQRGSESAHGPPARGSRGRSRSGKNGITLPLQCRRPCRNCDVLRIDSENTQALG